MRTRGVALDGGPERISGPPPDQGRRAFFRSAGRAAVLGTMGLFGLRAHNRANKTPDREVCINRSVCRTCRVFGECELPAARSAKGAEA